MNVDREWPEPIGIRLNRSRAAFETFSLALWGKAPNESFFNDKPSWVKESWAQTADAIVAVMGTELDPEGKSKHLRIKRAHAAFKKRNQLEDRDEEWGSPELVEIWGQVVDAVLAVKW